MDSTDPVKAGFWYCKESRPDLLHRGFPKYFNHLFCAFADISATNEVTIPTQYEGTFLKFIQTVKKKTLMSIGGLDSDPAPFVEMFRHPAKRTVFIESSIEQARAYNFDGLDLYWPCWKSTGPTDEDMNNLGLLLDEWRQAIVKEANNIKIPLLLSATVFYEPKVGMGSEKATYPTGSMTSNLDWINVRYDPISFPNGIRDWLNEGVPATQLVAQLSFVNGDKESIIKNIDYFKGNKLHGYFAWHVCADDHANWTLSKTAFEEWDK